MERSDDKTEKINEKSEVEQYQSRNCDETREDDSQNKKE